MKRNLLTLAALMGIAVASFAIGPAQDSGKADCPAGGWHHHGFVFDRMTETLNLTPDQQAKVKPIIDQARPQIIAIHQDAMQKTKAIMENAMAQIRPLLTPEQQAKADQIKKAHEDMRNAVKELHDAKSN
jgi:Spy/CpxP family protein refolding chaperone